MGMLGKFYRNRSLLRPLARKLTHSPKDFLRLTKHWALDLPMTPVPPPFPPYASAFAGTEPIDFRPTPALAKTPYLNVVLPGWAVHRMSGGPNTVINLAYRMAAQGVPVRFISASSEAEKDPEPMWRHVRELTGIQRMLPNVEALCANDRSKPIAIGENDVFMATAWWTAQIVNQALERTRHRKFLYVIQDFEPGLYRWSTEYALAAQTYEMNYCAIVNSPLLADYFFKQKIGRFADAGFKKECAILDTAVERDSFHFEDVRSKSPNRKKRLLFYARPTSAHRNLYELGVAALVEAARRKVFSPGEWEFYFMGEQIPDFSVPGVIDIKCLPWLRFDEYAEKMRQSDVVLSLMLSPHPSYPPLEAAACGAIAVTNTYDSKTAERLTAISPNIIAAHPSIDGVVAALERAVASVDDFAARRRGSDVNLPKTWSDAFTTILPRALEMWEECAGAPRERTTRATKAAHSPELAGQ